MPEIARVSVVGIRTASWRFLDIRMVIKARIKADVHIMHGILIWKLRRSESQSSRLDSNIPAGLVCCNAFCTQDLGDILVLIWESMAFNWRRRRGAIVGSHAGSERPWPLELQIGVFSHRKAHVQVLSAEILKCDHAANHLEVLWKHRMLGSTPRVSDSVGLAQENWHFWDVSRWWWCLCSRDRVLTIARIDECYFIYWRNSRIIFSGFWFKKTDQVLVIFFCLSWEGNKNIFKKTPNMEENLISWRRKGMTSKEEDLWLLMDKIKWETAG